MKKKDKKAHAKRLVIQDLHETLEYCVVYEDDELCDEGRKVQSDVFSYMRDLRGECARWLADQ